MVKLFFSGKYEKVNIILKSVIIKNGEKKLNGQMLKTKLHQYIYV